jgi:hypothetical protein
LKFLSYIKYFFFIAFNWNIRLAWFMISQEIRGEKKYHLDTSGIVSLEDLSLTLPTAEYGQPYQGANYYLLEKVFDYLKNEQANDSIVDYGSGKGRVMVVAAYYGFKRIIGIDFSSRLCEAAKQSILNPQQQFPDATFKIIHADATTYDIEKDDNVMFFFNPFDEVVMEQIIINIRQSLRNYPRKIYVAYINPVHKELFEHNGFKEVFYTKKMEYVEASVLTNT